MTQRRVRAFVGKDDADLVALVVEIEAINWRIDVQTRQEDRRHHHLSHYQDGQPS